MVKRRRGCPGSSPLAYSNQTIESVLPQTRTKNKNKRKQKKKSHLSCLHQPNAMVCSLILFVAKTVLQTFEHCFLFQILAKKKKKTLFLVMPQFNILHTIMVFSHTLTQPYILELRLIRLYLYLKLMFYMNSKGERGVGNGGGRRM